MLHAMQYEYGEVSQRLEDDSIEFRYNIINIFTKTVTSVAMLVALLIMALPSSPAFTVIVFIISLVKLIVPIAVRKLDKKYDTLTREYNEHITSIEMELTTKPHIVKMMGIDAPFRKKLEYGSPSLEIKTNLNSAALYPVNAMGTSKAMMEKVIVAKSRTVSPDRTKICCTRYGNVMCSRGSVIPLWIDQIRAGQPVTITDGSMTRFIMSLEEAVDLVLFAFEHGESGDILVQKAPACTIRTQAEAVLQLFRRR